MGSPFSRIPLDQIKCDGRLETPEPLTTLLFQWLIWVQFLSQIDLFASPFNDQIPTYSSWKSVSMSLKVDTLQQSGERTKDYIFPLFSLIDCMFAKVRKERCCTLVITAAWQKQAWYTTQLIISAQNPILTLQTKRLLMNSQGKFIF